MIDLYIWGSAGAAVEVLHIIQDINMISPKYRILGIVGENNICADIIDAPFISIKSKNWEANVNKNAKVIIAVGSPSLRFKLYNEISILGLYFATIIHPKSSIASSTLIGDGCIIGPNVTISPLAKIGSNTYISFNSSIGHHSIIGDHSVISPGSRIGGFIKTGNQILTGLGSIIVPRVSIGSNVKISAGALVTSDLLDNSSAIAKSSRVISL